jgi:hypothetical protein
MKTIEITPENAAKAFKAADDKGKALLTALLGEETFKSKSKERIETFEEALEQFSIGKAEFEEGCKGLEKDEIAYKKIKLIAKSLNNGWIPDWDNDKEYKYYPYFDMRSGVGFSRSDCGDWYSCTDVGSRLCFKSSDLATYAGKQFESIYKDFLTL